MTGLQRYCIPLPFECIHIHQPLTLPASLTPPPLQDREGLPSTTAVGDLLVIHDTGAHSHSMGFQYNGKLRAPELLIRCSEVDSAAPPRSAAGGAAYSGPLDRRAVHLIREREEVHCLFDNTVIPKDLMPSAAVLPSPYPYAGRLGKVRGGAFPSILEMAAVVGAGALAGAATLHLLGKVAAKGK